MKTVPELTTSRCILSQILDEDFPVLSQIMQDHYFQLYLPELYGIVELEDGWQCFLSSFNRYLDQNEGVLWGIHVNEEMIGFIAVMDLSAAPSIFYALHPSFRKLGYMKEGVNAVVDFLFTNNVCNHLQTEVYENNRPSLNILYANGFDIIKQAEGKFYLRKNFDNMCTVPICNSSNIGYD